MPLTSSFQKNKKKIQHVSLCPSLLFSPGRTLVLSALSQAFPSAFCIAMIALFQCCGPPFFGISKTSCGEFCGFGYRQESPIILRVRCRSCSQRSEVRLDAPSVMAPYSRNARHGIRNLRITQGIRLLPLQLSAGRLTEHPAEFCAFPRAWELSLSLLSSAAFTGPNDQEQAPFPHPSTWHQCSPVDLKNSASQHHLLASRSQAESACGWGSVKMKWKRTPSIDGRI